MGAERGKKKQHFVEVNYEIPMMPKQLTQRKIKILWSKHPSLLVLKIIIIIWSPQ